MIIIRVRNDQVVNRFRLNEMINVLLVLGRASLAAIDEDMFSTWRFDKNGKSTSNVDEVNTKIVFIQCHRVQRYSCTWRALSH